MEITVTQEMNSKLKALLCFAASKDVRYYLNGVLLEVNNGVLRGVATNGHFIGVTKLCEIDAPNGEWILPRAFVELIVKTRDIYMLNVAEEVLFASHGFTSKPIDGKFPEWRRVVTYRAGEESPANFDAELLHGIAKASRCLGNKHGYFTMQQFGTSSAPFQIADDFCGVIMPIRTDKVDRDKFNATIT